MTAVNKPVKLPLVNIPLGKPDETRGAAGGFIANNPYFKKNTEEIGSMLASGNVQPPSSNV